ncbi:MAG: aldolase/citrate lyase family protein [Rhodospirillales bacterium]|nr:aldolase/citrate lyase family protein [Rhodospirillales bacterium]MDH3911081.1 aldolase/citrate lyase family protein [Rhodospirillales bacterium]MDH3918214.1 aldolase/citrate lyase family protein [Rhodospirillales bacterium]MDH3966596.1 aldolase/citrate lyase family protein [Rhodospirillales bacterium]
MKKSAALKARLGTGRPVVGCWLHLFSPLAAEVVAQAGYDCVMIDLEHGAGSLMDAVSLMHAVQGRACAPLMRVPANDPVWIKRALDTGIAGVMVPAVNDAAEAEAAVAACRYPPQGRRGVAPTVVRASAYGTDWREYVDHAAKDLLVVCQIETADGVRNAAEIAAVEGLDMVFVGPFDLSAALGWMGEPDHPEVRTRIDEVEQAAKAVGKRLGGIPTPGRTAEALFAAGYDLVLADFDVLLLRDAARDSVARLRAAMAPEAGARRDDFRKG